MTDEPKNLDAILRKVQGLLNLADDSATPEAARQTYRDKAEALMTKYRIEESEAAARGEAPSLKPVVRVVDICPTRSLFAFQYRMMFSAAMEHAGARSVYMRKGDEYVGEAVGFESDVRYGEMLYTAARLVFQDRMEPRIDPSLSDQENVYRLRRSGIERKRIGEMMGWEKAGQRVSRLYEAECKKRGENPEVSGKGFNVKLYRDAYCEWFINEFWGRLYYARLRRGEAGAIVLKSRQADVDEAFYQRYPHLRPGTGIMVSEPESEKDKARRRRENEKWMRDEAKRRSKPSYQMGMTAGERAAQQVDIGGTTSKGRIA